MPYRNFRRNRRRSRYPKRSRGRRYPMKHMTSSKVRRIIDAELKRFVLGVTAEAPAVVGDNQLLTHLINQGVESNQRIGDWIKVINIHGTLQVEGRDEGGQVVGVRAFIIRWNEDFTHHTPTLEDLVNNTVAPHGQYNFDSRKQFKVVWSKNFQVVNKDNNPQYTKLFPFYLRLGGGPKTLYDGVGPRKYQYQFFIFSDTDDAEQIPQYRLDAVTRYTDS